MTRLSGNQLSTGAQLLYGDGTIQPSEWTKTCPGFSVADWLAGGMQPLAVRIAE